MTKLDKESAKLLKVDELKAQLKARRSSTGGKKSDLYDRLVALLDEESVPENEPSPELVVTDTEMLTESSILQPVVAGTSVTVEEISVNSSSAGDFIHVILIAQVQL